ncbi:MAG: hypothetical protein RLZZ09_1813, partial [Pseudomonadota bacterium]
MNARAIRFCRVASLIGLSWLPSLGWSDKIDCRNIENWDEKMTVAKYMADCDAALISINGCRLNIEKACINGVEVDLMNKTLMPRSMGELGFKSQTSKGVSQNDFADPSKMYTPSQTPGGKTLSLCSKIEGLSPSETANLSLQKLPTDRDYVIESTPAFINPRQDVATLSFHWRLRMSQGQPSYEVEIRSVNNLDNSTAGTNNKPSLTKARGNTLDEAFKQFSVFNLVRCKKVESFSDGNLQNSVRSIAEVPTQDRQELMTDHKKVLKALATSGLDTKALANNMQRVLNMPVTPEEDANPPRKA